MARRQSARSAEMRQALLYPVDWREERSGSVGGRK